MQSSVITSPQSSEVKESKHGRGRPRKEKTGVDYSDFPVNGSQEEQERWFKAKVMERWHFAKLSGPEGEEYRETESLDYYYSKHGGREQTQTQSGNDTGVKGVQYLDEPYDKKAKAKLKVDKGT